MRTEIVAKYPNIEHWLGPWLKQLSDLGEGDEYRVVLGSLLDAQTNAKSEENCARLNEELKLASTACRNLDDLIVEKATLPSDIHEANKTVLGKLSEIRAVVCLDRWGLTEITFYGTPDLLGKKNGEHYWIEVTRLGASTGKRSDVYDEAWRTKDGEIFVGMMSSGGRIEDALGEAVYREAEEKYRQLRSAQPGIGVLWISAGNDYFVNSTYSLPSMSLFTSFRKVPENILRHSWQLLKQTGGFDRLDHLVLCGDGEPIVWPAMSPQHDN